MTSSTSNSDGPFDRKDIGPTRSPASVGATVVHDKIEDLKKKLLLRLTFKTAGVKSSMNQQGLEPGGTSAKSLAEPRRAFSLRRPVTSPDMVDCTKQSQKEPSGETICLVDSYDSQESWITQEEIVVRRGWRCKKCIAGNSDPTEEERAKAGQCCCSQGKIEFKALLKKLGKTRRHGNRQPKRLVNSNQLQLISLDPNFSDIVSPMKSSKPVRTQTVELSRPRPDAQHKILKSFAEWSEIKEPKMQSKRPTRRELKPRQESLVAPDCPKSSRKQVIPPIPIANEDSSTSRSSPHLHVKGGKQTGLLERTLMNRPEPLYEELGIDRAIWGSFPRTPHGSYPAPSSPPPDDPLPVRPLRLKNKCPPRADRHTR